jgi:hypothetical protein
VRHEGWAWALLVCSIIAVSITTSEQANAQLVAGKGDVIVKEAHYIAVREGQRTVLYVRVAVDKSAEGAFDVVFPVVAAKQAAGVVSSQQHALFSYLDDLAAPRLVEYWEQDPCEFHTQGPDDGVAERDVKANASPSPPARTSTDATMATLESVADVVSALQEREHTMPAGADAILKDYESKGASFVVATAAKGESSIAVRLELDTAKLTIPVRLLSAHHAHAPRVVLDVLGGTSRFEAANRDNLAAPANTDVKWKVKGSTDVFHDAVLGRLFATQPDAVVTEYAWRATSCAPCPGPPLTPSHLVDLGIGSGASGIHEVMIFTTGKITKKPDGPPSLRKALMACFGKALAAGPATGGEVTVAVDVVGGKVTSAKTSSSDDAHESLRRCAEDSVKDTLLDGDGKSGDVRVQFMPMSRKFVADLVVTRLRAHAGEKASSDIELREGAPIAGGAEVGPTGGPKVGAYAAPKANHFQSRYTVRHKWAGPKPTCQNPSLGEWGAPPAGVTPKPPAGKSLTSPAAAKVEDLLEGELAGADKLAMRFPPRTAPTASPATPGPIASATPSAAPSASAAPGGPAAPVEPASHGPKKPWVGFLALAVCGAALWLSQRAHA